MGEPTFYVVFCRDVNNAYPEHIATSIQVTIPDSILSYYEALDYVIGRITHEVSNYAAEECLNSFEDKMGKRYR